MEKAAGGGGYQGDIEQVDGHASGERSRRDGHVHGERRVMDARPNTKYRQLLKIEQTTFTKCKVTT